MAQIFSGKAWAANELHALAATFVSWRQKHRAPVRMVSLYPTEDDASVLYTKLKRADAESVGVVYDAVPLSLRAGRARWLAAVRQACADSTVQGVLIQKPSKARFLEATSQTEAGFATWWTAIIETLDRKKDVDSLSPDTLRHLEMCAHQVAGGQAPPVDNMDAFLLPATAQAIIVAALEMVGGVAALRRRRVGVVGLSSIVGAPALAALQLMGVPVQGLRSRDNLAAILPTCDVIVAATGRAGVIQAEWLREGCVLIDCGAPEPEFTPDCYARAAAYTPVPGGIGPMTRACLLGNLAKLLRAGV